MPILVSFDVQLGVLSVPAAPMASSSSVARLCCLGTCHNSSSSRPSSPSCVYRSPCSTSCSSLQLRARLKCSPRSMAPDEEKMTRRSPLDFPIEWERPRPGRRPDIFPQFSPMKTPLPQPPPTDPPEEDEEEEEKKEEENPEEEPDTPPKET